MLDRRAGLSAACVRLTDPYLVSGCQHLVLRVDNALTRMAEDPGRYGDIGAIREAMLEDEQQARAVAHRYKRLLKRHDAMVRAEPKRVECLINSEITPAYMAMLEHIDDAICILNTLLISDRLAQMEYVKLRAGLRSMPGEIASALAEHL